MNCRDDVNNFILKIILEKFSPETRIVEIGPYKGKWGKLLKEKYCVDAIEICEQFIKNYELESIYNCVYNCNAIVFRYYYLYHLVILSDVLEHFTIKQAQYLLELLTKYELKFIVIVPFNYEQTIDDPILVHLNHLQPDLNEKVMAERYPRLKLMRSIYLKGEIIPHTTGIYTNFL